MQIKLKEKLNEETQGRCWRKSILEESRFFRQFGLKEYRAAHYYYIFYFWYWIQDHMIFLFLVCEKLVNV